MPFNSCGEVPGDGGELGNVAAVEELEGEKNGDLDPEKAGGKGRRVGEVQVGALGVVLDLQGSRWGDDRVRGMAAWRQRPCQHCEKRGERERD